MKKNLLKVISLVTLISLSGCNGGKTSNSNSNSNSTNTNSSVSIPEGTILYKVQVLLPNGEKAGEGLQVQWCNDSNCFSSDTNSDGVAFIYLQPDEYDVHVYNYPENYACELGIKSNEENSQIEVKLHDLLSVGTGNGTNEDPYRVGEGVYNVTLSNIDTEAKVAEPVTLGFVPTRPGKYVIESWTESTDTINTNVGYYGNNPQYIPSSPIEGMSDDDSGDSDNFRLEFNISTDEFVNTGVLDDNGNMIYEKDANGNYIPGGIYRFAIGATNIRREKSFPVSIKYLEHYEKPVINVEEIEATETLSQCEEADPELIWKDCQINGLDQAVYNEATNSYHLGTTDGYKLYVKITEPCLYIDKAFSVIQDSGNSALTLDNGTKDYTKLIAAYAENCNSDGVYPLTNELKTFLELYYKSISSWLYSVCETVIDEDWAWLFAVGYYANLEDFYDKPWSGLGDVEEPYLINNGTFLADVSENTTVYYSFGPRNTVEESVYRVKTNEANLEFVLSSDFNVEIIEDEETKYFDITLGGMANPSFCMFGIKTIDNTSAKLEFTLELREKAVAGDKITLGTNTVEVLAGDMVSCSMKVTNAGTYTITSNETNAWFIVGSDIYGGDYGEINFTVECAANEMIEFDILTINNEADFITFNIAKESSLKLGLNSISVKAYETITDEFIAPEAGTYKFTCLDSNGVIGYEKGNLSVSAFGDDTENYFQITLDAGEALKVFVTTANSKKGTVRFTIEKI